LHIPFEHTVVPGHFAPQPPQFAPSLSKSVSQPSLGSPSQFPQPEVHVKLHASLMHAGTELFGALVQAPLQLPQCCRLVSNVSQPGLPVQSPKLGLQLTTLQIPTAQPAWAFGSVHA
jgi:hypothetical protein